MNARLYRFVMVTLLTISGVSAQAVPIADANGPYTGDEGSTITLDGSGSSFATMFSWDLDNDGTFGDAIGVAPSITFPDDGFFSVGLQVSDGLDTDSSSAIVIINNVAPSVDAGLDVFLTAGSSFMSTGSFIDPGVDTWTATIDFGDGSALAPLGLNADGTFALSHVYAGTPGAAFVGTVTVTDDEGGVGSDIFAVTFVDVAEPTSAILVLFGLTGLGLGWRRKTRR